MRTPAWWYGSGPSLMPALLEPAALVWRAATWARRGMASPYASSLPVICIGNPTAGGAGKTPTAIAIACLLRELGERPVFLTRGYGGRIAGPHLVDGSRDSVEDIGDEALLLSRIAPAVVSADRAAGARFIETLDASVIVMDDGFHNPGLAKDFSLLVVDRAAGIGNGAVIPAGPLREGLAAQLARAQGVLLVGRGTGSQEIEEQAKRDCIPVLEARLKPSGDTDWIEDRAVIAFAGIGRPSKFFRDLEAAGARLKGAFAFPDHHPFTDQDAGRLLAEAERLKAQLVTTEKDWVRIERQSGAIFEALRKRARQWPVRLIFGEEKKLEAALVSALTAHRKG